MDKPSETPETIYLIPDSVHGHVWCDDPAPGMGMDPEDAVEYRRADAISPVCFLCSQTITGNKDAALEAAKARIAELEKALEPFAQEGSQWGNVGSHKPVEMHVENGDGSHSVELLDFTGNDLRRAAALLKEKE